MSEETMTIRQQQAHARRIQIIETAADLFSRQGIDGTPTKKIAEAAGISEGLIFHYFPTKADLLSAVLESQHSFVGNLRALLTNAGGIPVNALLPELAHLWLRRLRQEKAFALVIFCEAQTYPEVNDALHAVIGEGVMLLGEYLQTRVQAGELRIDLPTQTAALMFFSSAMIYFVSHRHENEAAWQVGEDRFVTEMLSIWTSGTRIVLFPLR